MQQRETAADIAILLYSKYSTRCQTFLRALEALADDAPSVQLHMLCVDNEEVRKLLHVDTHGYQVQRVPCVLVFNATGLLEKFEGVDTAAWLQREQARKAASATSRTETMLPSVSSMMATGMNDAVQPDVVETQEPPPAAGAVKGTDQIMTRKRENILSVAATMAKQREKEEENSIPNPFAKAQEAQQRIQAGGA